MKYFFNEEINKVTKCDGGSFVVTQSHIDEITMKSYTQDYLMDGLGRISEVGFDKIESEDNYGNVRNDGFYVAEKDKIKYFINKKLEVLTTAFNDIDEYNDKGYATIYFDERNFWIDKNGIMFGEEFDNVYGFENGIAVARLNNGKFVYVNDDFKIISPELEMAFPAGSNKYFPVQKDKKIYIADRNFNILSKAPEHMVFISDYGYVFAFSDKKLNGKSFDVFDVNGKYILSANIIAFSNEKLVRFYDGNGAKFLNQETGEIYGSEGEYSSAEHFTGNLTCVGLGLDENGEHIFGFINDKNERIGEVYECAFVADENLRAIYVPNTRGDHGKFYLIDEHDNISAKGFARLGLFSDGLAKFECRKDRWTFTDKKGVRFKEDYDSVSSFHNGFAKVKNANSIDFIDKNGVSLLKISKFVQKLENDPIEFLNMPSEFFEDFELISKLYECVIEKLNLELFEAQTENRKQQIKNQIETIKEKFEELNRKNKQKS